MLLVHRDAHDYVDAALCYDLVDETGQVTPTGRYVYLHQLELNPGVNLHRMATYFIQAVASLCPEALGAYWHRRDRFADRVRAYRRDQLLREEVSV